MSAFAEILAIEVGLRGVERVQAGVDAMIKKFELAEDTANGLGTALKAVGIAAGVAIGGIREAASQQQFEAMAEGLTNSLKHAENQAKIADRIAAKGLFQEDDIFKAILTLDKYNVSVEKNIGLIEKLGARSGNIGSAAELVGMIEGGFTRGLGRRLKEFGIGPDKLRNAGLQVEGQEIKGSSAEILAALTKIESVDKTLGKMSGTFNAMWGGMIYQVGELVESVGTPLLAPVTWFVGLLRTGVEWMKDLNNLTHGWISNFALGGTLIVGLSKVWGIMKELMTVTRLNAIWTGITTALMGGWNALVTIVKAVAVAIEFLTSRQKLAAAWTAILDALMGNWTALAAGAAVAVAVGVGGWALNNAINNSKEPESSVAGGPSPANRPIRRDDIERIHKKMYANAWTG